MADRLDNNELENFRKETVVVSSELLRHVILSGAEENHEAF
jgi:hypothetical protein